MNTIYLPNWFYYLYIIRNETKYMTSIYYELYQIKNKISYSTIACITKDLLKLNLIIKKTSGRKSMISLSPEGKKIISNIITIYEYFNVEDKNAKLKGNTNNTKIIKKS